MRTRPAPASNRRIFLSQAALATLAFAVGCPSGSKDPDAPEGGEDTGMGDDTGADTADETGTDSATDTTDTGEIVEVDPWGDAPTDCAEPTPETGTGPFYRPDSPPRNNINALAEDGTPVKLYFRVLDTACVPVAGAKVEIWHCAPEAEYDMTSSDMRFYGTVTTDEEGKSWVECIKPPTYVDDAGEHAPHIHFQITAEGFTILAFQVRFLEDGIEEGEKNPIAELTDDGEGYQVDSFNFVLERGEETTTTGA